MKKIITFLCVSLFCTLSIHSQKKKESREKIKALKIAYITEQLNLTSTEAEKFWPIYNAYNREQNSLRSTYKTNIKKKVKNNTGGLENINEEEAKRLISLKLLTDKELYESQNKFINQIKGILPYSKILKLQIAEMEFGRKLMRKYRHQKKQE